MPNATQLRLRTFNEQPKPHLDSEANDFRAASERHNALGASVLSRTRLLAELASSRKLELVNRSSHDGGIIYLQEPAQRSASYLRVVPNWVAR